MAIPRLILKGCQPGNRNVKRLNTLRAATQADVSRALASMVERDRKGAPGDLQLAISRGQRPSDQFWIGIATIGPSSSSR
jgi:hypothetical protein